MRFELTKEFLEEFRQAIVEQNNSWIIEHIHELHFADIADLLDQLPDEYIEDYDKWSIITNILKGLDKKDLWNKWSYQSNRYK